MKHEIEKRCSYPYEVPNAQFTLSADQNTVTYKCLYTDQVFTRTCLSGGAWGGSMPKCRSALVKTSCTYPPVVANSRFLINGFGVNSTVYYKCSEGFREHYRTRNSSVCLRDFSWTPNDVHCSRESQIRERRSFELIAESYKVKLFC